MIMDSEYKKIKRIKHTYHRRWLRSDTSCAQCVIKCLGSPFTKIKLIFTILWRIRNEVFFSCLWTAWVTHFWRQLKCQCMHNHNFHALMRIHARKITSNASSAASFRSLSISNFLLSSNSCCCTKSSLSLCREQPSSWKWNAKWSIGPSGSFL